MSNTQNELKLNRENWKDVVVAGIHELPDDIQQSVGYDVEKESVTIRVACEPLDDDDGESFVAEVIVRWWNTRREELECYIKESPGLGLEERLKWPHLEEPSVSIEQHDVAEPTRGLVPGRATVLDMKHVIQEAVLNQLFQAGGISIVYKNDKEHFLRDDGSYVLDWQKAGS